MLIIPRRIPEDFVEYISFALVLMNGQDQEVVQERRWVEYDVNAYSLESQSKW